MNEGMLRGMAPQRWENYVPQLDVWNTAPVSGSATTPALGTAPGFATGGRYYYDRATGLVVARFIIAFGSAGNNGGNGSYCVSLPVPARRQYGGPIILGGTGAPWPDDPLGSGNVTQGLYQLVQEEVTFLTSDYNGHTYGGPINQWATMFCPKVTLSGTATIASGTTSVAVTWPGSIQLIAAPSASDLTIVPTANTTTDPAFWWVSAISSTGFTFNCKTNPSTSGLAFAWKLSSSVAVLVGSNAPWNFGGAYDTIKGHLVYEADS